MRARLNRWLRAVWRKLNPPPSPVPGLIAENRALTQAMADLQARNAAQLDESKRWLAEMVEAQAMCGSGPWQSGGTTGADAHAAKLRECGVELREAGPVGDAPLGAYGMYELLLQNVNWQREINYSALEFTRWGIQQIILICRLYQLKNPIVRRLVDVIAQYVFARGYDVTTNDQDANDLIKDFIERNRKVLGHVALMAQQRGKLTDGNVFWAFFADEGTGECDLRTIDPTEINDIWTDPDDVDKPWYYERIWTTRAHTPMEGAAATVTRHAWYPAIEVEDIKAPADAVSYHPANHPLEINGHPVMWSAHVYHRKIGTVGKWLFGCPPCYPMLDWAKESRRYMEASASNAQALAQFALTGTTKGGQQAIEGIKQQMQTQVGPGNPIWDTNPPTVAGGTFISGPGTSIKAFSTQGAGLDPEKVRRFLLFCCMCLGMPETFLGDVSTGNLATATSLDRPTETVFLSIQEEWVEDLTVIVQYMLSRSLKASAGKLRESANGVRVAVRAAARKVCMTPGGARYWGFREAAKKADATDIEIRVMFPAIREGDVPALVKAGVEAMTLDNKGGQIVGVDEREGVLWLMNQLGWENAEEIIEAMYPTKGKDKYDPNRANIELPPPIQKVQDQPGVQPQPGQVAATVATADQQQDKPASAKEAMRRAMHRLTEAIAPHLED